MEDRHYNCQRKETKGETMIYKTLNRKIEQHEFRKQPEVNLGATGGWAVPALPVLLIASTIGEICRNYCKKNCLPMASITLARLVVCLSIMRFALPNIWGRAISKKSNTEMHFRCTKSILISNKCITNYMNNLVAKSLFLLIFYFERE